MMRKIFFLYLLCLAQLVLSTTKNIRDIKINGDFNDWEKDELIYKDSQSDSPWGPKNELHDLYVSWDENGLYLAVSGVQETGNNLIIYFDVSPTDGVPDVSKLRDPYNSSYLWWWRRNNKFNEGFTADFQLHLYEMKLNPNEGHGLFKINNDYTTYNLTDRIQYSVSGGGTGSVGYAEFFIPWDVLFENTGFPFGKEMKLVVCLTGGMDQRELVEIDKSSEDWVGYYKIYDKNGVWVDTATVIITKQERENNSVEIDEINMMYYKYGSAHDTIPDQKNKFTDEWSAPFTIDSWIILKFDKIEGRDPFTRNLQVVEVEKNYLRLEFDTKKFLETEVEKYKVYYSSDKENLKAYFIETATNSAVLTNIIPDTTYYFSVSEILKNSNEHGLSETISFYIPKIYYFDFEPKKYLFVNTDLKLKLDIPNYSSTMRIDIYYRHEGINEFKNISATTNEIIIPKDDVRSTIEFVCFVDGFRLPLLGTKKIVVKNVEEIDLSPFEEKNFVLYSTFGPYVEIKIPYGVLKEKNKIFFEYNQPDFAYQRGLGLQTNVLSVYNIFSYSGKTLLFEKPIEVVLPYFNFPLQGNKDKIKTYFFDGKNWVEHKCEKLANDKIKTKVYSTGVYAIGYDNNISLYSVEETKLLKVLNPKFSSQQGPYLTFVFTQTGKKNLKIFDLNNRLLYEDETDENVLTWHGKDNNFNKVPQGVYIYQIKINDKVITGVCAVTK